MIDKNLLDSLYAPQAWFYTLPNVLSMSIVGLIIAGLLGMAGIILARMGYKPLWALLLLVPTLGVIAPWVLAYHKFPREKINLKQ